MFYLVEFFGFVKADRICAQKEFQIPPCLHSATNSIYIRNVNLQIISVLSPPYTSSLLHSLKINYLIHIYFSANVKLAILLIRRKSPQTGVGCLNADQSSSRISKNCEQNYEDARKDVRSFQFRHPYKL